MHNGPLRVLLVEDDEDDHVLLRQQLAQVERQKYDLDWVRNYNQGLETIRQGCHDIYLVDYRLGGQSGIDLLRKAIEEGCRVPLIVLTGQHDYQVDVEAMEAGAADYLNKEQLSPALLERSIRYARERQRLLAELERKREQEEREREFRSLEAMSRAPQSVTAQTFGHATFREALPERFEEVRKRFAELLSMSLEERSFKMEQKVPERLRMLGEELGDVGCGPRDVIELYAAAMHELVAGTTVKRARALMNEGRIMALELMGHLVTYYRRYRLMGGDGQSASKEQVRV
jgi:DNA-binding response OmpR family regulator